MRVYDACSIGLVALEVSHALVEGIVFLFKLLNDAPHIILSIWLACAPIGVTYFDSTIMSVELVLLSIHAVNEIWHARIWCSADFGLIRNVFQINCIVLDSIYVNNVGSIVWRIHCQAWCGLL